MDIQEIIFNPYAIIGFVLMALLLVIRSSIKKMRAMNKIDGTQTFKGIDELRYDMYLLSKFSEDIDDREKKLIEREISNLTIKDDIIFVTAEEVVASFNRAYRQGFEEIRKKFRESIMTFIEKNLISMNKEGKFDLEKLEGLDRLARCINQKVLMEQIEIIKKIHHPVRQEENITA
jgi:hypothetical protein